MPNTYPLVLILLAATTSLRGAVVAVGFPQEAYRFHGRTFDVEKIPIPLPSGSNASLALYRGGLSGSLLAEGAVRFAITVDPPPNIGGKIRALEAGDLIGAHLSPAGAGWWAGEAVGEPGESYATLYDSTLQGRPDTEFFATTSFIGLEFTIDGSVHYGYLLVKMATEEVEFPPFAPYANHIIGFAYETEAGIPIIAGVPEPAGLLLIGFSPVLLLRRRRLGKNVK